MKTLGSENWENADRWRTWIVAHWPRAGLVCAVVILALLPILADAENWTILLAVTLLPIYMIHQYEEHAHGRFLAYFNATIGKGYPVLTLRDVFWINVGGVWGVFIGAFYLARFVDLAFVLVPIYLTLTNGVIHVLATITSRQYNPGLWTGLFLFVPWAGALLLFYRGVEPVPTRADVLALLFAIALHAVIVVYALRRRATLMAEGGAHFLEKGR